MVSSSLRPASCAFSFLHCSYGSAWRSWPVAARHLLIVWHCNWAAFDNYLMTSVELSASRIQRLFWNDLWLSCPKEDNLPSRRWSGNFGCPWSVGTHSSVVVLDRPRSLFKDSSCSLLRIAIQNDSAALSSHCLAYWPLCGHQFSCMGARSSAGQSPSLCVQLHQSAFTNSCKTSKIL